jgi:hypothetical protein
MATFHIYTRRDRIDGPISRAYISRNINSELDPNNCAAGFGAHHVIEGTDLRGVKQIAKAMAQRVYFGNQEVR